MDKSHTLRIIIAGSRTIDNYNLLGQALHEALINNIITHNSSYEIVSGGAIGVDTMAKR